MLMRSSATNASVPSDSGRAASPRSNPVTDAKMSNVETATRRIAASLAVDDFQLDLQQFAVAFFSGFAFCPFDFYRVRPRRQCLKRC
jgi:hypothetical protein